MEEHLAFLAGLKKLGRSNWRGISRLFVKTRTPTQVRSAHLEIHVSAEGPMLDECQVCFWTN